MRCMNCSRFVCEVGALASARGWLKINTHMKIYRDLHIDREFTLSSCVRNFTLSFIETSTKTNPRPIQSQFRLSTRGYGGYRTVQL